MFGMSRETYTVRDMAVIISRSSDPKVIERFVRQIRYWTTENILVPIGKKHSGSGKYREYSADEIYKAAITAELVRHGVSVTRLEPLGEYLDMVKGDDDWNAAIEGKEDVFFIHCEEFSEDGGNISKIATKGSFDPLSFIERRDEINANSPAKTDFMNYPTAIIINLTKLFSRLDLGRASKTTA